MKEKHIKTVLVAAMLASMQACTITDTTSTTSGSVDAVTPDISLNRFVDVRIASIRKEAATGQGENLVVLAKLMNRTDTDAFASLMHEHYDELFNNLQQPIELISRINNISTSGTS